MNKTNAGLSTLYFFLKFFVIILTLPLAIIEACLVAGFVSMIFLITKGVILIGPLLVILGVFILIVELMVIIYKSLLKGGLN